MLKKEHPQHEKEEDPREMHHGLAGQDSPIKHQGEETEMTEVEAEVEAGEGETHPLPPEEIKRNETMERS